MTYIRRLQENLIDNAIQSPFMVAILGPRRVGKSTYLKHYIEEHPNSRWVKFNMDSLQERNRIRSQGLRQMIEEAALQHLQVGNKIWVAIDEVQKCPEIFEQIKILYDEFKSQDALQFVMTGSAHLDLHQKSAESLAGRIQYFNLREFALREQLLVMNEALPVPAQHLLDCCQSDNPKQTLEQHIHEVLPLRLPLVETLEKELVWGGFPEVLSLKTADEKHQYTAAYIQTYLENDVRSIQNISDLSLYQNILQIYAEITGSLRDDQKLIAALGCARNTLIKYTGFMEATLLLKELQPFIYSTIKRITKSPKMYVVNNSMISYLTGLDQLDLLEKTGRIGHRLENWFLKELLIWNDRYLKKNALYYWRLASGREVDFIVQRGQEIYPFEVTYDKKPSSKKIGALSAFLQEQPNVRYGFYVYNGEFCVDEKSRIIFIPAWAVV